MGVLIKWLIRTVLTAVIVVVLGIIYLVAVVDLNDYQPEIKTAAADQGLMLSFLLDLPRVCDPESWFVEMAETARRLAEALDAEIVDDRGMVLTEQAMGLIREQVRQRAETLTEAGLRPGGVLARGIFQ